MRVAVVTAAYQPRLDWLRQCHASVRGQTHACTHILVSDGDGPQPLSDFEGQFIQLGHRHNDWGDTPRSVGAISAFAQGFDAVCWLDSDNWFYPEHVATLVKAHEKTGLPVCTSTRDIYHLDGSLLGRCPETDGIRFVDANCFLITRQLSMLTTLWATMPAGWHICGDMYFFAEIKRRGIRSAHVDRNTVAYRATRSHVYQRFGVPLPPGVKDSDAIWQGLVDQGLVKPPSAPP